MYYKMQPFATYPCFNLNMALEILSFHIHVKPNQFDLSRILRDTLRNTIGKLVFKEENKFVRFSHSSSPEMMHNKYKNVKSDLLLDSKGAFALKLSSYNYES